MNTITLGYKITARLRVPLSNNKWEVDSADIPEGFVAVLNSRTPKLYQAGDQDTFWVYDVKAHDLVLLSDSEFGRLPISDRMRPRYIQAIHSVLKALTATEEISSIVPEHVSEVKGLLNRCVRKDQWDWFTVYDALGKPPISTIRQSAQILGELAKAYKAGDYDSVKQSISFLVNQKINTILERGLKYILANSPRLNKATTFDVGNQGLDEGKWASDANAADPYIVSQVARAKLERANKFHEETLLVLVRFLQSNGFVVENDNLIDVYCRLKTGPAIFEVKSITADNERSQFRHALSQLYEYRYLHSLPDASLWLVLSIQPKIDWIVEYLQNDRGVSVLWVENGILMGSGVANLLQSWRPVE